MEEVEGEHGAVVDVLDGEDGVADEEVVEDDGVVATGHAVVVAHEGVADDVDGLLDAGPLVVLAGVGTAHHAQARLGVVVDGVVADLEATIGESVVVDELDAVFVVAVDEVVADDVVEGGARVGLEADLDAVAPVVADDVVLDDDVDGLVGIDAVVGVLLEEAVADGAAAAVLVVDAVGGPADAATQEMELGASGDAVVGVLDGEAHEGGLRAP